VGTRAVAACGQAGGDARPRHGQQHRDADGCHRRDRRYHLSPRGALSELRHAAQWPPRLLCYADARGGPAHLRIVPTAGELVPASL
jgi:hypothetical protein